MPASLSHQLRTLVHLQRQERGSVSDQQLVARIKRTSKYWGQTAPNQWFDVRVVEDTCYHLRGNNNNYRLGDVVLGMRLANGSIVDLSNGKMISADSRAA